MMKIETTVPAPLKTPAIDLNKSKNISLKQRQIPFTRLIGNQQSLMANSKKRESNFNVQPKMRISEPGDKYELEADRIAGQIMRMPETGDVEPATILQSATSLQTKKNSNVTPRQSSFLTQNIQNSSRGGRSLSSSERSFFEPRFRVDFGKVRIHTDAQSAEIAHSINARAFTHKNHVIFGKGEYAPGTTRGRQVMAHELTHTIQQQGSNSNSLIQRDEVDSGSDGENVTDPTQNPPAGFAFDPSDLMVYPLFVDIWSDIANHNVDSNTLDQIRLQGIEDAALWNSVLAIPFASASIPEGAGFFDFLSAWNDQGDQLQALAGGGTFLLDFFSAFAGVNIESYLATDLFLNRLKQHALSVGVIYAVIQGASSLAALSGSDAEDGEFAASQLEMQTAVLRQILGLVLKEQFKAPDFFDVSPIRLETHPAYGYRQSVGGEPPEGLILEHAEGIGEGQGGNRLRLGLTLNLPQLLGGDANNLQQYRDWQGSLWFNYNQINPTQLQLETGAISESDFRVGSIFGGAGFLGLLEGGARYSGDSAEARELTAWFLHGGFGYSGDSNNALRRLGFNATYTDWTDLDVLAPRSTEGNGTAGNAFRFTPFTQLQFGINERHQFAVGAALGFVTGNHENFGVSDITGNLSYIYQGERAEGQLPEFRVDLSGSLNRLDWWNPDSPLMTGIQARVGVDRFFVAGQLNLGAADISEDRAANITRFSSDLESDRFRIRAPTGLLISAGILLGPGAGNRP